MSLEIAQMSLEIEQMNLEIERLEIGRWSNLPRDISPPTFAATPVETPEPTQPTADRDDPKPNPEPEKPQALMRYETTSTVLHDGDLPIAQLRNRHFLPRRMRWWFHRLRHLASRRHRLLRHLSPCPSSYTCKSARPTCKEGTITWRCTCGKFFF